jgi:hypothetical protein
MNTLRHFYGRHSFSAHVIGLVGAATTIALVLGFAVAIAQPIATAAGAGDPKASLREAILTDYEQGKLPPGFVASRLSADQRQQLLDRIAKEMGKHFTGPFLTTRISDLQEWASAISGHDTVRLVDVKLKDFQVDVLDITGDTALATGTFTIYMKNQAKGDDKGHEVTWGGTGQNTFAAQLQKIGGQWLVSSYYARQTDYTEDPSARSGWEYLPSGPPPATAP